MRTIAVANQKGGCGKTTVSINLAACLAREGRRTLLVDMDPQGHCALGLAVPEEQIEVSIFDVLTTAPNAEKFDITRAIWQISANFDLCPSTIRLSHFEPAMVMQGDAEDRLMDALCAVKDRYDFVVVDCPPHLGLLTLNALAAASEVLIPVDTGYFSLQGLSKQLETLDAVRSGRDTALEFRVLANLYDVRTKLGREILNELRRKFGPMMCHTFINFNTKLREGASYGQPITEYDPTSMGFRDFVALARELISAPAPEAVPTTLLRQADDLASKADKLLASAKPLFDRTGKENEEIRAVSTPEQIQDKIDHIYGAQTTQQGVIFTVHAPGAYNVALAGDFNNWKPEVTPMSPNGREGSFQVMLPLEQGRYRYRFVIDGSWRNDPSNDYVEINPFGEFNSVIEVG